MGPCPSVPPSVTSRRSLKWAARIELASGPDAVQAQSASTGFTPLSFTALKEIRISLKIIAIMYVFFTCTQSFRMAHQCHRQCYRRHFSKRPLAMRAKSYSECATFSFAAPRAWNQSINQSIYFRHKPIETDTQTVKRYTQTHTHIEHKTQNTEYRKLHGIKSANMPNKTVLCNLTLTR